MLNLLKSYIPSSLPADGFVTNPNLTQKVDGDGNFLPFRGNTAVFLLKDGEKEGLAALREELYAAAPEMLSARLGTETFHMTLHDLVNGSGATEENMARTEGKAKRILKEFSGEDPIPMRGTWTFNMVNTSIVLGLEPETAEGAERLSAMYRALESAVPLGYALTPHITLAYFRPGVYGAAQLAKLRQALKPADISVTLHMDRLALQYFEDMNHYITIH